MRRRGAIAAIAGGSLCLAAGGFGYVVRSAPHPHFTSFAEVTKWFDDVDPAKLSAKEGWPAGQALAHCAQSIEMSMAGFPEMKSGLFRATVGPAVFHVFDALGAMRHDLESPIPGAPPIAVDSPVAAVVRLRAAMTAFANASRLEPHFAYGELTVAAYERAHAMHISEHLTRITR